MIITEDIVDEFNEILSKDGCIFKLELIEMSEEYPEHKLYNPEMKIVPANDKYLWKPSRLTIEVNSEFYKYMESFFQSKGIELEYNELGSRMWSKNGLNHILEKVNDNDNEMETDIQSGMEFS